MELNSAETPFLPDDGTVSDASSPSAGSFSSRSPPHGINQGSPEQGVPGWRGTADSVNHPGSWVQVTSTPELNPGRRDFVISAWVKLRIAPRMRETNDLLRKGLSFTPGGQFKLEIGAGGRAKCTIKDTQGRSASIVAADVDVADRLWHRVGCAGTGNRLSVLLDETVAHKRVRVTPGRNVVERIERIQTRDNAVGLWHLDETTS